MKMMQKEKREENRQFIRMDYRLQSPYCGAAMKISSQQKGLIMQHLIVRKLTRRELEDKYLRLIDENFDLKRENNVQKEKIKVLTTKLLRVSKENNKFKSREFLFMDNESEIIAESQAVELMRYRPSSTSVLLRSFSRGSTRSDLQENVEIFGASKTQNQNQQQQNNKILENGMDSTNFDTSNKIKELQEEVNRLACELTKLKEMRDVERTTNEKLEHEVSELKEKLSSKNDAMTIEREKRIKDLETQLKNAEEKYSKLSEDAKHEQEKLSNLLKNEQQKNESQKKSFETSQQAIETLTERVASLEKEKSQLSMQSEKFTKITQEAMNLKKNTADLSKELLEKQRELEKEREDKATIEHSHSELLRKIKDLQKENDELVVKLEGLKTENDGLMAKNKKLEEQIRTVEGNNKIHLQQINDTLKVPSEQSRVSKVSEITRFSTPPISDLSFESPSTRIPHLSINDESRSTPEKHSTIPPLSPSVKSNTEVAFVDTFSRSVSKEDDDDDHFDTKTYSIDQVSDTEGLSELIEDDDEVDTVSFAK